MDLILEGKQCKIYWITIGKIVKAHAVFIGNILNDGPNIGGGPKLSCIYFLDLFEDHYYSILNDLSSVDGAIYVRQIEDLLS